MEVTQHDKCGSNEHAQVYKGQTRTSMEVINMQVYGSDQHAQVWKWMTSTSVEVTTCTSAEVTNMHRCGSD